MKDYLVLKCSTLDNILSLSNMFNFHIYIYRAAEFVIYRLKEMGKICQEDIATIMEQFEDLDVDQSGTLSPSDILLAQSSFTGK